MDEDTLNDLKQFITATVSQAAADLATKDDLQELSRVTKEDLQELSRVTREDLQKLNKSLGTKIDDLELKVDTISEALHEHLGDHETRITKLEQQAA